MSLFCCTLGTGRGKAGEHRPRVGRRVETELQCHCEGVTAVLWFFVPPQWSTREGRAGVGTVAGRWGPRGSPRWTFSYLLGVCLTQQGQDSLGGSGLTV